MYPTKTDRFSFVSTLTELEIKNLLEKNIHPESIFQLQNDHSFYGYIKNGKSKFSLGQYPSRNSFRPIIKLTWNKTNNGTEINGYLSLNKRIPIFFLVLPLSGIYFSILNKIVIPFIFLFLLYSFLLFALFQPIYNYSKKNTLLKLGELIKELQKNK